MKINNIDYYWQKSKYSCGPTVLKMVFEYLGKRFSRKRLAKLCKANPKSGTSHKDMANVARNAGFNYFAKSNANLKDLLYFLVLIGTITLL